MIEYAEQETSGKVGGRYGVISQKVVLFIITAVGTSDPTVYVNFNI
jgi:hypothetical protein